MLFVKSLSDHFYPCHEVSKSNTKFNPYECRVWFHWCMSYLERFGHYVFKLLNAGAGVQKLSAVCIYKLVCGYLPCLVR